MTSLLLGTLLVFVLALLHAMIVNGWREALKGLSRAEAPGVEDAEEVRISVIIPARNAAATIAPLLQDLHRQTLAHERFDVLVVNDHSEDDTSAIARGMTKRWPQLQVIDLDGSQGKKAAISEGVGRAAADLVLVSDADVRSGPDRLRMLAHHWHRSADDMILMPVRIPGDGLLGAIQEEEQLALLAVAAGSAADGSPVLANGANMAFARRSFNDVNGFEGDRWASGDDLFLLSRMRRARKRIGYLLDPSVVVEAATEPTWGGFFSQRMRWAGKMRAIDGGGTRLGAFAVLVPWSLIACTIAAGTSLSFGQGLVRTAALIVAAWLLWLMPVVALVSDVRRTLHMRPRRLRTTFSLLCFPLYALPVVLLSLFARPVWKGRRI
jgi:cellulose synthase/poly-beta-1,6-N-acetylglucosamine synthase-like glycosyltransferase